MKSILLTAIFFLSSFLLKAQIEYPRLETDSLGQQIVIMTIEQAQQLDNNSELLLLFENLNSQMLSYDSICVKVINDKEYVISTQKLEISKLKESLNTKNEKIKTLQDEIDRHNEKILILESQLLNRNQMIEVKDQKIKSLKTKMFVGGGIGGVAIIGLILGILVIN
jgi:uncharacterized protein (DUF3084 family)